MKLSPFTKKIKLPIYNNIIYSFDITQASAWDIPVNANLAINIYLEAPKQHIPKYIVNYYVASYYAPIVDNIVDWTYFPTVNREIPTEIKKQINNYLKLLTFI